jgi:cobalamin synthase
MNEQWRLYLAALRFFTRESELPQPALRFVPVVGIVMGAAAAGVYFLAAQLWPSSVAVVLSMLTTSLVDARGRHGNAAYWFFVLLVKYNALMALSAAIAPVPLPEHLNLGLIMICAQAAAGALMASQVVGGRRPTAGDLTFALLVGSAPATLLGIPGLVGLGAAIVMRMLLGWWDRPDVTQPVTEICFYLGALATWKYV